MKKITLIFSLFLAFNAFAQNNIPNVDVKTIDGTTVNIQDVTNQDHIIIVSLWATWCVPCIKELDAISDVYEDWQDETGVELIAVSVDDSRTVKTCKNFSKW